MSIKSIQPTASYLATSKRMQKSVLYVYCEGTDAEFYKKIFLFYQIEATVINPPELETSQSGCTRVISEVSKARKNNSNVIGLIDGDFQNQQKNRHVLRIDYYSLENIIIDRSKLFSGLLIASKRFYSKNHTEFSGNSTLSISKCNYSRGQKSIVKSKEIIDPRFYPFIYKNISSGTNFVKYMDLKKATEEFSGMRLEFANKSKGKYLKIFLNYSNEMSTYDKNEAKRRAELAYSSRLTTYKNYKLIPIDSLELPKHFSELFEPSDRKMASSIEMEYKK